MTAEIVVLIVEIEAVEANQEVLRAQLDYS
jgi:hypothetical protein